MGIGEVAALSAAALWTFSSLLYTKIKLSAWNLNFTKIVIASVILFVQLVIVSRIQGTEVFHAPAWAWGWLTVSGLVGLVLGDTCYFRSLQILGVRRCLIVTTTAPIFTAILSWLFRNEGLETVAIVGVSLAVVGIIVVVADQDTKTDEPGLYPGSLRTGLLFGVAASLCQAIGAVASRHAMASCDALEATFIRIGMAAAFALLIVGVRGQLVKTFHEVANRKVLKAVLPAVICGTWLGVWFSQIAFKQTLAAVAQTLLSTSPLFAIPMVWWISKRKPSSRILLGAVVAVVGVFLMVGGKWVSEQLVFLNK